MFDIQAFIAFVRELYGKPQGPIPLHAPVMGEREKTLVGEAIDSTYVSSVGAFVPLFEERVAAFTGARYAVATVSGTAALHVALLVAGVQAGDLVLTQALTFVATCNAIRYCGADPVFVDVEEATLGMDPEALQSWLSEHAELRAGRCVERESGRAIRACVPMHTLGHPARITEIAAICERWGLVLVEDAAEALGSYRGGRHVGTFGRLGVLSFNGNKVVTTGGGGMILTGDEGLARRARHLTTTAKRPHLWRFDHDEVGYNYRLPNLNAAFGVAQMERLGELLDSKRRVAMAYASAAPKQGWRFVFEPAGAHSNYWLNALRLSDSRELEIFLRMTNDAGVMTRPLWTPMHRLPMYARCVRGRLNVTEALAETVANVPSSALTDGST